MYCKMAFTYCYKSDKIMLEYAIIPVTFKDYNEYIKCLNDYGKRGWVFSTMIRTYKDSPIKGQTTHDFICYRKKKWWRHE